MKTFARLMTGAAALMIAGATMAPAEPLNIVSFGGAYGAAQKKHMIDPFVEATGTEVVFSDYSGGVAEIKAQTESGNIQWDVVDIEVIDLERACSEGMLEVIPRDILPAGDDGVAAMDDFYPDALASECGVGVIYWGIIYAFDGSVMTDKQPSTIADLFDLETFPGKRAFRKRPQVNMEWALIADGVPMDEIYDVLATEEGQARAFAKLDTIKDEIVWFDSWSQAPQLLNDGGAVMVQSANGRIFAAIQDEGKPFEMVWDGMVFDLDVWAILKGSPNLEKAKEFVAFATQTVPLSGMVDVAYGPTRKSGAALVDPAIKDQLPTAHLDQGMKADGIFWADFGESLGEKFNEWLLQ